MGTASSDLVIQIDRLDWRIATNMLWSVSLTFRFDFTVRCRLKDHIWCILYQRSYIILIAGFVVIVVISSGGLFYFSVAIRCVCGLKKPSILVLIDTINDLARTLCVLSSSSQVSKIERSPHAY